MTDVGINAEFLDPGQTEFVIEQTAIANALRQIMSTLTKTEPGQEDWHTISEIELVFVDSLFIELH